MATNGTTPPVRGQVDFGDEEGNIIYSDKHLLGNKETVTAKKRFLKAYEATLGVLKPACKKARIGSRETIRRWKIADPAFKFLCNEVEEGLLDFAESSAYSQIRDKNTVMTMYFLRTKGRSRGWAETTTNINVNKDASDLENLSDDELVAIIKGEGLLKD